MKGTVAIFHTFFVDIRALVLSFLPKPLTAPHTVQPHISIFFEIWNSKYYFCTAQRDSSQTLCDGTRPKHVCSLLHHPSSCRCIYTFSSPLRLCCICSLALSRGLGPLPDLVASASPLDVLHRRNNAWTSCMTHLHKQSISDQGYLKYSEKTSKCMAGVWPSRCIRVKNGFISYRHPVLLTGFSDPITWTINAMSVFTLEQQKIILGQHGVSDGTSRTSVYPELWRQRWNIEVF